MPDISVPIWWGVWAWLTTWWLSLLFSVIAGPLILLVILHFVVVTIGMVMVSFGLFRRHWLL